MIRASITAVPRRFPVLWGKAVVYGLVTVVLMVPSTLIAFAIGEWIFSGRHINVSLSDPGVPRVVLGAALYLTVVGLFGFGLGAIVRNTAGGIATFAGLMFVLPPLMNVLPASWNSAASPYLPLQAGEALLSLTRGNQLAPDAFILAIGLPEADGRDVCQALRSRGIHSPVLFLTARESVAERISGFDAGGDDYVTKPFAFAELVARLHALLRRGGADA